MTYNLVKSFVNDAVREWLTQHHTPFRAIVERAAEDASPLIAKQIADGLLAMIKAKEDGNAATHYLACLEETQKSLEHLIAHSTWSGKDDLQPILNAINTTLEQGGVE